MFLEQLKRFFGGSHRNHNLESERAPTDIDTFIEERRPNLAQLNDEEVERRSDAALSKVDRDKVLGEAKALREQWK